MYVEYLTYVPPVQMSLLKSRLTGRSSSYCLQYTTLKEEIFPTKTSFDPMFHIQKNGTAL